MGIFDKLFGSKNAKQAKLDVSTRFRLERQSTAGTMSTFRAANEIGTNKVFGIKFLDQEKTDYFKNRFKGLKKPTEGEIAVQIKHERIVETYEFGETTTGQEYILMEYIDGPGLDALMRKKDHDLFNGNRLSLIRQMAEAIPCGSRSWFYSPRCLPKELYLQPRRDLAQTDRLRFDRSRRTGVPPTRESHGNSAVHGARIVRRRQTDIRVDIFAFGVTIYRFLTFEHPWGDDRHDRQDGACPRHG